MLMFTLYTNSPVSYEFDSLGKHQPGVINEIIFMVLIVNECIIYLLLLGTFYVELQIFVYVQVIGVTVIQR